MRQGIGRTRVYVGLPTYSWSPKDLLRRCQLPDELLAEDMGTHELRGKSEAVGLYSVRAR